MPLTTFAEIGHLVGAVERSQAVIQLLGEDEKLPSRLHSLPEEDDLWKRDDEDEAGRAAGADSS